MKAATKLIAALLTIVTIGSGISCKKEVGEGGNSTIRGRVWVKHYDPFTNTTKGEYVGGFRDVYIIYGDDSGYGDKIETTPEGMYEFKYLRPGRYTIYTYSHDITLPFSVDRPDRSVVQEVEITKKKQTVEAPDLVVDYYKI